MGRRCQSDTGVRLGLVQGAIDLKLSQCPGKVVARECSSERILLSTHMQDHWVDLGCKPDNTDMNEVGEGLDIAVKIDS